MRAGEPAMPVGEFGCLECGRVFNRVLTFGDDGGLACPYCESQAIEQLVTTCQVVVRVPLRPEGRVRP
jgi:putative FmdB family regulatory protein